MSKYQILLLDMDGTFFDFPATERRAFFHATRECGLEMSEESYQRYGQINLQMWKRLERGEINREQLKRMRFEQLFSEFQIVFTGDWELLITSYYNWLAQGGDLYPGAWELWRQLHQRYKLCVLTNGNGDSQRSRMKKAGVWDMTDGFVASGEIGKSKPDPAIYTYAMEQMGSTDPADYLVIGDSYSADIQGALRVGIDAIWFNPAGESASGPDPLYTVSDYEEIRKILQI